LPDGTASDFAPLSTANWDWLDYAANFSAGWADGLTFGVTDTVRDWFGTNDGIDHESGTYVAGTIGGAVNGALLGGGAAGGVAQGGRFLGFATRFSKVYTSVETIYAAGSSAYNVATGKGTVWDALPFIPAAGFLARAGGNRLFSKFTPKLSVAPNSVIKLKPGGSVATPQFSRFKSPQRWINNVVDEHLSNVELTYHPKYNGRLKDFGRATLSLDATRRKTTIGRKALINIREMVDTIVHEELHHRLWDRWLRGSKRAEDIIEDIDYEELYIEDVVRRFLRMKGLE
jgi:hypothetical protein